MIFFFYVIVDFGFDIDFESVFVVMCKFFVKGFLVNFEFYIGWIDYWGEKYQMKVVVLVVKFFDKILFMNVFVNIYMYEGGINFGFMNGVNYNLFLY